MELQGGNKDYIINPDHYPKPKHLKKIRSVKNGFVEKIDTYQIGMASLELGAGRKTKDDVIDHKAGLILHKKIGDLVKKGEIICELHSDSQIKIKTAERMIRDSIQFSKTNPSIPKLIKKVIC